MMASLSLLRRLPGRRCRFDRCRLGLSSARLRPAAQYGVHLIALHPWQGFGDRHVAQFFDQPLENAPADLRVRHFAAAEEDRGLHLVAVFKKALDVLFLELVVVLVDFRPELDFLDLDDLLVPPRLAGPLLLLVLILAEIHDPADWRGRRRGDFHEVEPLLPGDGKRLRRRHDAELLSGVVDDADFADADTFVDPHAIVAARSSVECDKASFLDPGGFAPADPPTPTLAGAPVPRSAPAGAPVARLLA